jgi:hypothetical protein
LIFFSSNSFNINWLSISAVLDNNQYDTGVCLVRVVSMSQTLNPHTPAIIQHPVKVMAPYTSTRNVGIEAIFLSIFQSIVQAS